MKILRLPGRTQAGLALAAMVSLAACQDNNDTGLLLAPDEIASAAVQGSFVASSTTASVGEQVTVGIRTSEVAGVTFAGLQGTLRYDASALELEGQITENGNLVVINDSEPGAIRLQALNVHGLGNTPALFSFRVKQAQWAGSLAFDVEHLADTDVTEYDLRFTRGDVGLAALPGAEAARAMSFASWVEYLDPSLSIDDWHAAGPLLSVASGGQQRGTLSKRWGDANGDDAINVLDNVYTANLSVGNAAQAECILSAALVGDCVAVNVDPANLPGLGGPTDDCLPGITASCGTGAQRVVNVLDNLRIALESTNPGSQDIAGKAIPLTAATSTVDLCVGFNGGQRIVTGTLSLTADTDYTLGNCRLSIGDEAGLPGTLEIEAGVTIEGTDSSSIDITRNGQIFALGTYTDPILMTCVLDGGLVVREPECWGGLQIVGNAVINTGDAGTAPAIPGRNPAGGGQQGGLEGFIPADLFYGGANDADNSGTLRHVIIAYGGRSVAANNELNNLTIGACGSGTTLEFIQTHAGSDDGLEIFGGRCNIKGLVSTLNDDDQFDLSFGYDGSSQFVFLRSEVDGTPELNTDNGLEWDGNETAAEYGTATPATTPVVWNATAIAGNGAVQREKFANIRRGAGGDLNNFLVAGYATGLDLDNVETCGRVGVTTAPGGFPAGPDAPDHGFTFAGVAFDVGNFTDGDCVGELDTFFTGNAMFGEFPSSAGVMKDPFDVLDPDIRPFEATAGTAIQPKTPPATGFFDTGAVYHGAAAPIATAAGGIPFYAGWMLKPQSATIR